MRKALSAIAGAALSMNAFGAEFFNPVEIITVVPHSDVKIVQYKVTEPVNGSTCRNDTRIDQFGIERGLAAVWLAEPCRDCDNLPLRMQAHITYKKVLVDLLNAAASDGSLVRLVTDGCTPKGRANIVGVVAH